MDAASLPWWAVIMVETLRSWPFLVLAVVLAFRTQLAGLLGRVDQISVGDGGLRFRFAPPSEVAQRRAIEEANQVDGMADLWPRLGKAVGREEFCKTVEKAFRLTFSPSLLPGGQDPMITQGEIVQVLIFALTGEMLPPRKAVKKAADLGLGGLGLTLVLNLPSTRLEALALLLWALHKAETVSTV